LLDEDFTIETSEAKTLFIFGTKGHCFIVFESIEQASWMKHNLVRILMKIICSKSYIPFGHQKMLV